MPSHQVVLYTNHLPKVGANDDGIWRRLKVIPFNAKIKGNSDIKNYADYLYEKSGSAIMKWIIEGAEKVSKSDHKVDDPKCVRDSGYSILGLGKDLLLSDQSLLEAVRKKYLNWLEKSIRIIYNSGGFLPVFY